MNWSAQLILILSGVQGEEKVKLSSFPEALRADLTADLIAINIETANGRGASPTPCHIYKIARNSTNKL